MFNLKFTRSFFFVCLELRGTEKSWERRKKVNKNTAAFHYFYSAIEAEME
jgi:hypothetical protein